MQNTIAGLYSLYRSSVLRSYLDVQEPQLEADKRRVAEQFEMLKAESANPHMFYDADDNARYFKQNMEEFHRLEVQESLIRAYRAEAEYHQHIIRKTI